MLPGEHVHIISAGGNIHTAYSAAFRILPPITRTFVLADSTIYEKSPNPEVEKTRFAVRNAVSTVKEISASLSIPFSRELIFPPHPLADENLPDERIRIDQVAPVNSWTGIVWPSSYPALVRGTCRQGPWKSGITP